MKKYIILLVCAFCISSFSGISQDPPNKPLPDPPVEEIRRPDKPLPVPPPDKPLPVPPPDKPLPEEPRTWSSATPNKEATREKNMWQRNIDEKWFHGNQGFNISFRHIIGSNLISASEGVSNWFAACGTLSGLYDQVLIKQNEVTAKQGYWEQFVNVYGRKDVSVFHDFNLGVLEMQIDESSAYELALIMDYYGPFVIVSKEKDIALVVSEIDYSGHSNAYRISCFNPVSDTDLKKGGLHHPVYPKRTNYDTSLTDFKSFIYLLRANVNNGPVSIYLAVNGDFDRSLGVNQRARSAERNRIMVELVKKYKNQ